MNKLPKLPIGDSSFESIRPVPAHHHPRQPIRDSNIFYRILGNTPHAAADGTGLSQSQNLDHSQLPTMMKAAQKKGW